MKKSLFIQSCQRMRVYSVISDNEIVKCKITGYYIINNEIALKMKFTRTTGCTTCIDRHVSTVNNPRDFVAKCADNGGEIPISNNGEWITHIISTDGDHWWISKNKNEIILPLKNGRIVNIDNKYANSQKILHEHIQYIVIKVQPTESVQTSIQAQHDGRNNHKLYRYSERIHKTPE